jgi:hypothetical protein
VGWSWGGPLVHVRLNLYLCPLSPGQRARHWAFSSVKTEEALSVGSSVLEQCFRNVFFFFQLEPAYDPYSSLVKMQILIR